VSRIPREIDEAMWRLAESRDPEALEAFVERYPDFKVEMTQRLKAMDRLRQAKPQAEAGRFRAPVAPAAPPQRALWAVGALAAASLVFAGYVIGGGFERRPEPQPTTAATGPSDAAGPSPATVTDPGQPSVSGSTAGPQAPAGPPPDQGSDRPPIVPVDPFDRLVTVQVESGTLSSVLDQVAAQAGIRLLRAPGFVDEQIQANYVDLPARQVLADLGQAYGFTVVQQEGAEALVIPALDQNQGPVTVPPGSGTEPTDGRSIEVPDQG
jgi:hypothetical protein